jgi:gamma-carbonic anhydrase
MGILEQLALYLDKQPRLGKNVFLADGAVVVGDVAIGDGSSIWFNAVLRGDINRVEVGRCTNVQDNAVLHVASHWPCVVGHYVTIGHSAVVHACQVGDETLIGMGAVVLDGAVVGAQCIIGAKALVTQRMVIPDGSLVMGAPAKIKRPLTTEERAGLKASAEKYTQTAAYYLEKKRRAV